MGEGWECNKGNKREERVSREEFHYFNNDIVPVWL